MNFLKYEPANPWLEAMGNKQPSSLRVRFTTRVYSCFKFLPLISSRIPSKAGMAANEMNQ